jgi:outer membrane protein OmpA-like peptidoglycan-associated protein
MSLRPMSAHGTPRRWSLSRALTQALLLSLMPLGIASAQPLPYGLVQVTRDHTDIRCIGRNKEKCMTAPKGTVLEVLYIEGDRYNHRKSNWYWVLLPPDRWGRWRTGWVRGNAIEHVPPRQPAPASEVSLADVPPHEPRETTMPAPVEEVPAVRPVVTEVVVNFEFGKSALTDEARRKLDAAFVRPTSNTQGLAIIALEGHTDWIGREAYNQQLGLARAETVKRYLTERLGVPAERINVVSYGETHPAAPNTTREGRALNRRVMIQVGG